MKITVYQDTICPWCYIGKRFLRQAINQWDGNIEVEYKSFFLNPGIDKEGEDPEGHLEKKYGKQKAEDMREKLKEIGEEADIEFNFQEKVRIPNTLYSHQLIKIFPTYSEELLEAIYKAYFIEKRFIGSIDVLIDIADDTIENLDKEKLRKKLENNEMKDKVFDDYRRARKVGVQGVPFFIFNNEQALHGAHKPETILQVIKRIDTRENIQLDILDD